MAKLSKEKEDAAAKASKEKANAHKVDEAALRAKVEAEVRAEFVAKAVKQPAKNGEGGPREEGSDGVQMLDNEDGNFNKILGLALPSI